MEVTVDLINEHNASIRWTRYKPNWLLHAAEGNERVCPADHEEICVGNYRMQNVQLLVEGIEPGDDFKSLQTFAAETSATTVFGLQPDRLYCVTVRSQSLEDVWSLWSQKFTLATLKEVACDFGKTAEDFSWLHWGRPVQEEAGFADTLGRLYRVHYDAEPPAPEDERAEDSKVSAVLCVGPPPPCPPPTPCSTALLCVGTYTIVRTGSHPRNHSPAVNPHTSPPCLGDRPFAAG